MGAAIGFIPMVTLIRRIDECSHDIANDRDLIVDLMTIVERRLTLLSATPYSAKKFHECKGTSIILKIIRALPKDEVILRIGFGIFEVLRKNPDVITDFIKFGGLELLDKGLKDHSEDDYLRQQLPGVKRDILATGADAAMEEILRESTSLKLCNACQDVLEREFRMEACISDTYIPKCFDRVNRILFLMDNYPRKKAIQKASLDALLFFARNADAIEQVKETNVVPRIASAIRIFKNDSEIIWRSYLTLALLAGIDAGVAFESTRLDIHEAGAEIFMTFERDPRTQQQILWMQASILTWPQSSRKAQTSKKVMDFYVSLIEERAALMKRQGNAKGMIVQDKFKPYKVIVPMQIRAFVRATKGEVVAEKKEDVVFIKPPERKQIVQKPLFGTVNTELYKAGEEGLL